MHDVFATLLKETWRLGNGSNVLPFLVVSMRNRALDLLRRRTRRQARELEHVERSALPAADQSLRSAQVEEVERLLRQISHLPEDLKEALSLRTWGELTFEEIADLQKVTKSTAHARFNQALEQLRRELPTEDRK
jgi:RNA polymerase sigma factor (sigma-70 family)